MQLKFKIDVPEPRAVLVLLKHIHNATAFHDSQRTFPPTEAGYGIDHNPVVELDLKVFSQDVDCQMDICVGQDTAPVEPGSKAVRSRS